MSSVVPEVILHSGHSSASVTGWDGDIRSHQGWRVVVVVSGIVKESLSL